MLPTVVVTSVVRSTQQGESHGGVYLVDLETEGVTQVIDWDDESISWEGRGADRGLRGVAYHGDTVVLAASDEVFFYDKDFNQLGSVRSPYLHHCHEIDIADGMLWLSSTGYNAVLGYDLEKQRFTEGYHLYWTLLGRQRYRLRDQGQKPVPAMAPFDPESADGPEAGDKVHINNVICRDGAVYVSGTEMGHLLEIRDGGMTSYSRIPYGTHNSRPFRGGVLMNNTKSDSVLWQSTDGDIVQSYELPVYPQDQLVTTGLPTDHARQAFGRGLATHEDRLLISGSSPATVNVYDLESGERLRSVNLTMDVRNAVHGLEVWPF